MANLRDGINAYNSFVSTTSAFFGTVALLLCLITALIFIKIWWFKRRLTFETQTPSNVSTDNWRTQGTDSKAFSSASLRLKNDRRRLNRQYDEPVSARGVFRKRDENELDTDIVRPTQLPPIRLTTSEQSTSNFRQSLTRNISRHHAAQLSPKSLPESEVSQVVPITPLTPLETNSAVENNVPSHTATSLRANIIPLDWVAPTFERSSDETGTLLKRFGTFPRNNGTKVPTNSRSLTRKQSYDEEHRQDQLPRVHAIKADLLEYRKKLLEQKALDDKATQQDYHRYEEVDAENLSDLSFLNPDTTASYLASVSSSGNSSPESANLPAVAFNRSLLRVNLKTDEEDFEEQQPNENLPIDLAKDIETQFNRICANYQEQEALENRDFLSLPASFGKNIDEDWSNFEQLEEIKEPSRRQGRSQLKVTFDPEEHFLPAAQEYSESESSDPEYGVWPFEDSHSAEEDVMESPPPLPTTAPPLSWNQEDLTYNDEDNLKNLHLGQEENPQTAPKPALRRLYWSDEGNTETELTQPQAKPRTAVKLHISNGESSSDI